MNAESAVVFDRILSALLNGTVQGALMVLILWLSLRVLSRTNAATRHALGLAVLILTALLPIAHFFGQQVAKEEDSSFGLAPTVFSPEMKTLPANFQSDALMVE